MIQRVRQIAIWLILPLLVLILYKRIPIWLTNVEIPKEIQKEIDFSLISNSKRIVIKGLPYAFNPAFIKYQDRYLLITRSDSGGKISFFKKIELYNGYQCRFHLIELDQDFNPIQSSLQEIETATGVHCPHDPRFFVIKNELYIIFNMPIEPAPISKWFLESSETHRRLHIAKLSCHHGLYKMEKIKRLDYPDSVRPTEKNWVPFVYNDELYVNYTISPYTILHVDLESGLCEKSYGENSELDWSFGDLRGGTQGIKTADGFLSIFHSNFPVEPTYMNQGTCPIYFMGAYLFEDTPPFRIKKISRRPFAFPSYYKDNNKKKVVFPSGAIVEGDNVYIALGRSDKLIEICTVPLDKLLSSMVDYE